MGMPVTIILLILLLAGLATLSSGLILRRGTRPSCRRCAYDLSALTPARCPECNEDLAAEGAIRLGDRRKRLAWSGAAVAILALLGLAYMLIQSPAFDRLKPVWLLRAEMAVVNDAGDERVIAEFRRRIADPSVPLGQKWAIADAALDAIESGEAPISRYDLLIDAARAGAVPAERALKILDELVDTWPLETPTERQFPHGQYIHKDLLIAMIHSTPVDFERVRPIYDEGLRKIQKSEQVPDFNRLKLNGEIISSWWGSPGAPSIASDEFLSALFRNAPLVTMRTRETITSDAAVFPIELQIVNPQLIADESVEIVVAERVESISLTQNGQELYDDRRPHPAMSATYRGRQWFSHSVTSTSENIRVKGLKPGKAELVVVVRSAISRREIDAAFPRNSNDLFDPTKSRIITDKTVTLRADLDIRPPGGDPILLLTPGEGSTPTTETVLEHLRFTPLRYSTAKAWGSSGPWHFSWTMAEIRHDLRSNIERLSPDVAFRVVAEQGETTWTLGSVVTRRLFHHLPGYAAPLSTGPVATRRSESGIFEWAQPRPDLTRPVRVRLVPDPDLARRTVDMHAIFGVGLDLGLFEILPVEGEHLSQEFQDATLRAPILSE